MTAGIVLGVGLVLAAIGFLVFVQDRGLVVHWWHWLLLALLALIFLTGVGALGTSLAEDTPMAGWTLFGIALVISAILGAIVARTMHKA